MLMEKEASVLDPGPLHRRGTGRSLWVVMLAALPVRLNLKDQ